jgi:muramoyltetrapeptide carboxypeptidase LdcA involved in peptidoglycan recycling
MRKRIMDLNKNLIFPTKLQAGDSVAIIAPSRSFAILSEDTLSIANDRLKNLGLTPDFTMISE